MQLDTFKNIYRYKPLEQKICLLVHTMELVGNNRVRACDASWWHNIESECYYRSEEQAMEDRVSWLMNEIMREIKNNKHMIAGGKNERTRDIKRD